MLYFLALLFGGFSAAFALILELVFLTLFSSSQNPLTNSLSETALSLSLVLSLLLAALIEEGSKLLFLRQLLARYASFFSGSESFVFLAISFGLGFALPETLLALGSFVFSPWILGMLLLHLITSFVLLLFLRRSLVFGPALLSGFGLAFFLHLLYNFLAFTLA